MGKRPGFDRGELGGSASNIAKVKQGTGKQDPDCDARLLLAMTSQERPKVIFSDRLRLFRHSLQQQERAKRSTVQQVPGIELGRNRERNERPAIIVLKIPSFRLVNLPESLQFHLPVRYAGCQRTSSRQQLEILIESSHRLGAGDVFSLLNEPTCVFLAALGPSN